MRIGAIARSITPLAGGAIGITNRILGNEVVKALLTASQTSKIGPKIAIVHSHALLSTFTKKVAQ